MSRLEQGQEQSALTRRRFLGLAAASTALLVDRKIPSPNRESLPTVNYEPTADREATIRRLQGIVSGERHATQRELFETIADTFTLTADAPDADDALIHLGENFIYTGYYRRDPSDEEVAEVSYVTYSNDEISHFDIEMERLKDGKIRVNSYDQNADLGKYIKLTGHDVKNVAGLLLKGLSL